MYKYVLCLSMARLQSKVILVKISKYPLEEDCEVVNID